MLEPTGPLKLLDAGLDTNVQAGDEFNLFTFTGTLTSGSDTQLPAIDLDGDGVIGDGDLNLLLSAFGTAAFDLDGDGGAVDVEDLGVLLGAFGGQPGDITTVAIDATDPSVASWNTDAAVVKVDVGGGRVYLTGVVASGAGPLAAQSVPEPAALVLLLLGALGILPMLRRRVAPASCRC